MEKKSRDLIALSEILGQRVIGESTPVLGLLDLVQKWPDIVGDFVAEQAYPLRLQKHTLVVKASSSVWAQELQMMSVRLIAAIQEKCPNLPVKKLRIVS